MSNIRGLEKVLAFCLITYLPSFTHSTLKKLTFLSTYPPLLINVVCEQPLRGCQIESNFVNLTCNKM